MGVSVVERTGKVQYELVRSRGKKRLSIRIADDARIIVTAPLRLPVGEIDRFVFLHRDWIEKKTAYVLSLPAAMPLHSYTEGDRFLILGRETVLHVVQSAGSTTCRLEEDSLVVRTRHGDAAAIRKAVLGWYREYGEILYGDLVSDWVERLSFPGIIPPSSISMAAYPKRMGSCSRTGELRFALRSLMLPLPLVEYLALHETAHLVHFNHGRAFKALLDSFMPDWRERQRRMKDLRIRTSRI